MASLVDTWPLFGLRIETPRVTLRPPTDDDFPALLDLVRGGIHDPTVMPFSVPWTDFPSPYRETQALQHWWRGRADWTTAQWELNLAVFVDGEVVGMQALHGTDFPASGSLETGSWLGRRWQGKGIGTDMRRAAVHFAFEALEANQVTSAAFIDNVASQRVSEKVGYEPNGQDFKSPRGVPTEQQLYLLTRRRWQQTVDPTPINVTGFHPCRSMFGL